MLKFTKTFGNQGWRISMQGGVGLGWGGAMLTFTITFGNQGWYISTHGGVGLGWGGWGAMLTFTLTFGNQGWYISTHGGVGLGWGGWGAMLTFTHVYYNLRRGDESQPPNTCSGGVFFFVLYALCVASESCAPQRSISKYRQASQNLSGVLAGHVRC